MATVWLARDLKHDRPVALKVLDHLLSATLGSERFLREIKLAARLQHPHIVPVYDSGESAAPIAGSGRLWFTMPYVDGESLRDRLRREGALPQADAVRIALQAAQALDYAHREGVIHRDVKPENILLARDGTTLVADFGIARPFGPAADPGLTVAGTVVGTPAYMSPEQAAGAPAVGPESDVYSLGCVLFEMLSGQPPFQGATPQALMVRHMTEPAPQVSTARGKPAAGVARVVARALAKSPAERFRSAEEFADALRAAAGPARDGYRPALLAAALGALVLAATLLLTRGKGATGADAAGRGEAVASGFDRKLAQLTFGEGVEEWPAWSPDGRKLAFVAEADGYRQLFVRDLAAGTERRISSEPRDHIQPTWSPEGARLAYVRAAAPGGRLEPNDIGGWYGESSEIRTVELATGRDTRLVENAYGPAWSPDGHSLAFDAQWAGPRRIWIADPEGGNPRQLTTEASDAVVHVQPRWSPDGTRLVFRRVEKTVSDIAVAEAAGGAMHRLTNDNVLDTDPVWSPSGSHIFFASYRGGGLNVWRMPVDREGRPAGPPTQITTGAGDDVQVAVAPDGSRLAFAVRGINADLWRLPVSPSTGQATGPPEAVLVTTRVESRGSWSPDGSRIAFNSDRLGEMNIWVRDLAKGTESRVTEGSGGDYQPTWSPDGRRLVFFSARGENTDIWSVDASGGALTRLTDDPGLDANPFYSPDGSRIAFVSDRTGHSDLWLMNADGSGQRQLTTVGVYGHFVRWTGDGGGIVFRVANAPEIVIYRVSIADGALTRLRNIDSGGHMSFAPDGSIAMDVRGHKVLWAYPMDGRPAYQVFEFESPEVRIDYPTWSPDGQWILFDRAAPLGGDLWLLEGIR